MDKFKGSGNKRNTGKGGGMIREIFLTLALLALLGLAVAITSGVFGGPSDLEMRIRASEPVNL
jgi:hypothetical protein